MSAKNLDYWVTKLTKQNMPVVGKVSSELNVLTGNEESDITQLAEVILRDPNLTSHVLRIANSSFYNYSSTPINTISKATVLIGLKGMKAICISLLMLDSLLSEAPKERLLQLIAQGLHAATQARDLIKTKDEDAVEEVFIAALLFNLGEMAFLSHEPITGENAGLMSPNANVRRETMERFLGTSFKAITRSLAKLWKLGETLESSLTPSGTPSEKVTAVILGDRISRAALAGWDSSAVERVVAEMADFTGLEAEACFHLAQASAEQAADVALQYGVAEVGVFIPDKDFKKKPEADSYNPLSHKVLKGDAKLQLSLLRDLDDSNIQSLDVNAIFNLVIKGMHQGIGIERVVVAFLARHRAKAKYILGDSTEGWDSKFDFDVGPFTDNVLTHAIESGGATWVDESFLADKEHLFLPEITGVLGKRQAFIYVLQVEDRIPALFYVDRADFGGVLNADQFDSFCHFAAQAQLSLNVLAKSKKKHSDHKGNRWY